LCSRSNLSPLAVMALTGAVKSFNPTKGFGFIIGADGADIFLHIKACVDGGVPQTSDTLAFDTEPSRSNPNQMTATNVTGGTATAGQKGGGKGGSKGGSKGTGTQEGTVKTWTVDRGFGFIAGSDGADIYLHVKHMADGSTPQQGDWLSYDTTPSDTKPDQMTAVNVAGGTGYGRGDAKGGGYGPSKGDPWGGAAQGGKGSPYGGGDPWGGKGGGWGAPDPWSCGKGGGGFDMWGGCGGGDAWKGGAGKGGGDPWGMKGGDPWAAAPWGGAKGW